MHYEPWELRLFENIECQWPLFFCYLVINAYFEGDVEATKRYSDALNEVDNFLNLKQENRHESYNLSQVMVHNPEDGLRHLPELYSVRKEDVTAEELNPGSQVRVPVGRKPFMWAQSLFVIGRLLCEGFIAAGEIDPINRRLSSLKKPDVVVQVQTSSYLSFFRYSNNVDTSLRSSFSPRIASFRICWHHMTLKYRRCLRLHQSRFIPPESFPGCTNTSVTVVATSVK